ncbi:MULTISPECIES: hypothetical protein [unclassified Shimia]|uniref:hypothetical protein n=1 Tax=unclassified Shimia TaxID=2630038 RepID=UPI0031049427
MKLLARLAMLVTILVFSFGVAVLWITAFLGETEMLMDTLELPLDTPVAPMWALIVGLGMMLLALGCLAAAFWALDRILVLRDPRGFATLALYLRRCAYAFMAFWVSNTVILSLLPVLLTLHLPAEQRPTSELFPLDIEIVFLVLAVVFLAISQSLRQAQDIADENSQFL